MNPYDEGHWSSIPGIPLATHTKYLVGSKLFFQGRLNSTSVRQAGRPLWPCVYTAPRQVATNVESKKKSKTEN